MVQDQGRFGLQYAGINPSGAMDRFAAALANAVLGKDLSCPVLEMHFPASTILFLQPAVIAITGADFTAMVDDVIIPMNHPVVVNKNSVLKFTKPEFGMRACIAFLPSLKIKSWMNSFSTNIKAAVGGYKGRLLENNDVIDFDNDSKSMELFSREVDNASFSAQGFLYNSNTIHCLMGNEWNRLRPDSQDVFLKAWFEITNDSDRMGYLLAGQKLLTDNSNEMVSAPAKFGTIQLLPSGQLIILMADHQTTGGYPRIAHIISADLPVLSQKQPGKMINFAIADLADAEQRYLQQQHYLHQVRDAVLFKLNAMK